MAHEQIVRNGKNVWLWPPVALREHDQKLAAIKMIQIKTENKSFSAFMLQFVSELIFNNNE